MKINKEKYIGGGLYAKFDGEGVEIWTNDGVRESDVIYFDRYDAEDLMRFFQECFSKIDSYGVKTKKKFCKWEFFEIKYTQPYWKTSCGNKSAYGPPRFERCPWCFKKIKEILK